MFTVRTVTRSLLLASTTAILSMPMTAHSAEDPADSLAEAVTGGTAYLNVRLRYENVDQANFTEDANAFTIRTKLGYKTGTYEGFSGVVEFEDSRNLADEKYNNTINGLGAIYPVVADPSHTEVNQAYLRFTGLDGTKISAGRQSINLGNQRFVGTVGWRQNDQNLDSVTVVNTSLPDTKFFYGYVWNVNRIFGNDSPAGDHSSNSHLFNAEYSGFEYGTVTAYAYLLNNNDVAGFSTNTIGVRFAGKAKVADKTHVLYELEYANQTDAKDNPGDYSVNYILASGGVGFAGASLTATYESLGSDDGNVGFATPLATLHKFNGWADKFLATPAAGLDDLYFTGAYKFDGALKGLKAAATYHKFTSRFGDVDYGTELDLLVAYAIDKNYSVAVKYADYNADTYSVDTRKLWFTIGLKY
ncbi:alginate export family protein [Paremcibacter congregatus]|uniref:alginate export family protein n=1 Tax=Paremcibacter congregatus TaxID=2043170 RepID=UPI0030EED4F7|tara:strand:+ start:3113 stop:4360 length:1248 start_codon:yes stop_codon:yes gene_type:complete